MTAISGVIMILDAVAAAAAACLDSTLINPLACARDADGRASSRARASRGHAMTQQAASKHSVCTLLVVRLLIEMQPLTANTNHGNEICAAATSAAAAAAAATLGNDTACAHTR